MGERVRLLLSRIRGEAAFSSAGRLAIVVLVVALLGLVPIYHVYVDMHSSQGSGPGPAASRESGDSTGSSNREVATAQAPADERTQQALNGARNAAPDVAQPSASIAAQPLENASASVGTSEEAPGPRIAGVRPISRTPPDARNTTGAIRNERLDLEGQVATRDGSAVSRLQNPAGEGTASRPIGVKPAADGAAQSAAGGTDKADPSKASAVATAAAADDMDVALQSRLAATRDWLAATAESTNTIQLLGVGTEERLKADLRPLLKVLEPDQIYVFRTLARGKPWFTVAYGSYPDRRSAVQAVQTLPSSVAANQPFVRTVAGIRSEQKQFGVTQ